MAHGVCPVWVGYLLASPVRKWLQDPHKILGPFVKEGMQVMDVGSAMGFFSIPLAQLTGSMGKVYCVDLQEKMLRTLQKRGLKAGVADRLVMRHCRQESLGVQDLCDQIDFALTFAVVHEVPTPARLLTEIFAVLKPGGTLLLAEPSGHVSAKDYAETLSLAKQQGFIQTESPKIRRSHATLLQKRK